MELLSPATDGGHLANQATLAQAQQFPPQGAVASVASAESLQTPGATPRSQSKRGRPSKSKQEVWTKSSTETLFTVRFLMISAWCRYVTAKKTSPVLATTLKLAPLGSSLPYWPIRPRIHRTASRNARTRTCHSVTELLTSVMLTRTALLRAETAAASAAASAKKNNGECVEEVAILGLRSLADGVRIVGETMKARTSASSDTTLSQNVITSLSRQEEAFKQQTAAINELVCTLKVISSALRLEIKQAS
ncbi:hypothetical protein GQ600_9892 [Phytophthora cactorum]|nr:hypothetical protein GQ600_9892 [Phytophthora cactorum]